MREKLAVQTAVELRPVTCPRNWVRYTALHAQEGLRIGIESSRARFGDNMPEFVRVDIDDNSAIAANQVVTAIEVHKPVAVLGAIRSDHALVIAEIAESRRIPFITSLATNPKVTDGKSFVFRTCFDDRQQALLLASFILKEKKRKRIAVLFNRTQAFAIGFAEEFARAVEKQLSVFGARVLLPKGYGSAEELGSPLIAEMRRLDVDAVVMPAYQLEAANLLSRLSPMMGDDVQFFGPDSWGGGRIFHAAFRGESKLQYRAFYVEHWAKESLSTRTRVFLQNYERFMPVNPGIRASSTADLGPVVAYYELVVFFHDVWRKKKSVPLVDRVREADFSGPRGRVQFSAGGSPDKSIHLFAIGAGSEKYLGTYGKGGFVK